MNIEKREKDIKRLVSSAKAIISNQVGIPAGCQRIIKIFHWLHIPPDKYKVFYEYREAVAKNGLPIGTERLLWNREGLAKKDKILNAINEKYYNQIIKACWEIVDDFKNIGTH